MRREATRRGRHRSLLTAAVLVFSSVVATASQGPAAADLVQGPENYLGRVNTTTGFLIHYARTNGAGDSAVTFQRGGDLYARTRPAGGTWGRAKRLADETGPLGLALDGQGNPTVAWATEEGLWVRSRTARGWGRKVRLPGGWTRSGVGMAQNDAGALLVTYSSTPGVARAAYRSPSGRWLESQVLFRDGGADPVAMIDGLGRATAAWMSDDLTEGSKLWVATSDAAGKLESPVAIASSIDQIGFWDVATGVRGDAALAWQQQTSTGTVNRFRLRSENGSWGPIETVGRGAPQLAVGPRGEVWLSAVTEDSGIFTAQVWRRSPGPDGAWSAPEVVVSGESPVTNLRVRVSESGSAVAAYRLGRPGGANRLWVSSAPGFSEPFSPAVPVKPWKTGYLWTVSSSRTGDALITFTSRVGPDGTALQGSRYRWVRHLYAAVVDETGPTARVPRPNRVFTPGTRVETAWRATDAWSDVVQYDVMRSSVAHDGSGVRSATMLSGNETSASFLGRRGRTYCFSVVATDAAGNTGLPSRERCTAVPLDERDLVRRGGWHEVVQPGAYRRTVLRSSRHGAALSTRLETRRIKLVATTCSRCGKVSVYLDDELLARVSLASETLHTRRTIPVARFPVLRSGTLRLVVSSARRPVVIDALATSRR